MSAVDTCDIPVRDRNDFWAQAVSQVFASLDVSPDRRREIRCRLSWRDIGRSRMVFTCGTPQVVCRTAATIASDHSENVILMYQKRGFGTLLHQGRSVDLKPGTMVAMDTRSPYRLSFLTEFDQQVFRFPSSVLGNSAEDLIPLTATTLVPSFASRLLLAGFAVAEQNPAELGSGSESPLLDLARLALAPQLSASRSAPMADRLWHARHYIKANLGMSELSPESVAAGLGVSLRTLQKMFALEGDHPASYILNERLTRVGEALISPGQRSRTIRQVAESLGFKDPSHFSRVFRDRYGMTPRDWRKAALREQE